MVSMPKKPPFALVYAAEVKQHLRSIEAKYHSLIRSEIEIQLLHEPDVETRNRKPLHRPMAFGGGGEWELRSGPKNCFRVFYQVDAEHHEVRVLAIGVKKKDRLVIGGEEVE
jgi:mRNA-degrading endonuclease RelE of RelBE toxin-antitoxin system